MKTWAYAAGAIAAVGVAAAVVTIALRRSGAAEDDQIPRIIADCQKRVDRIEQELRRLQTAA
jgi:hypothetical protein